MNNLAEQENIRLKQKIKGLNQTMMAMKKQIQQQQVTEASHLIKINELQEKIQNFGENQDQMDSVALTICRKEIKDHEKNVKNMRELKVQQDGEIKRLTDLLIEKDTQIADLKSDREQIMHEKQEEFQKQSGNQQNDRHYRKDQKKKLSNELQETTKALNTLQKDMEDIIAENRVLRKLAKVPDNYGFNLENVKLAEKQKIENYKRKVQTLEAEVEELEQERSELRWRIRKIYSEKNPDEIQKFDNSDDEIKKLKNELKNYKEENRRLRENEGGETRYQNQDNDGISNDHLKSIMEEITDLKKTMKNQTFQQSGPQGDVQFEHQSFAPIQQQPQDKNAKFMQTQDQNQYSQYQHHAKQPYPIAGPNGEYDNVNEGISHRFGQYPGQSQKININLYELYNENGFDETVAKQEIATLQLMNIENFKIIEAKEKEYNNLMNNMNQLQEDFQKQLIVQDNLFKKHFEEIEKVKFQLENEKKDNKQLCDKNQYLEQKNKNLESMNSEKQKQSNWERERTEMITQKSVNEAKLIKLLRKYDALQDDYLDIQEKYKEIDIYYSNSEQKYVRRLRELLNWKQKASSQLKYLLKEQQNSVSKDMYNTLENVHSDLEKQRTGDKVIMTELKQENAKSKGFQREVEEKNDIIHSLQEDLMDLTVELEMANSRLCVVDKKFQKFQETFKNIVQKIKGENITPLQLFREIDQNKNNQIDKQELWDLVNEKLGMEEDTETLDNLFRFLDQDGDNYIDYKEFLRKLKRAGVNMRSDEELIIYDLYKQLKKSNFTLKDLFKLMDTNGDNAITKREFEIGMESAHIGINKNSIEQIFKMADISGDGQISFQEFRTLFDTIIADDNKQNYVSSDEQLTDQQYLMLEFDKIVQSLKHSLIDIYKIIDLDDDQSIKLSEFKNLFSKFKLNKSPDAIRELFIQITGNEQSEMDYNQLLSFVREARKADQRIQRIRKLKEKAEEYNKQMSRDQEEHDDMINIDKQQRTEVKLNLMKVKEEQTQKRIEQQKKKIKGQVQEISQLERKVGNLETELLKANQMFFEERSNQAKLRAKMENVIEKNESELIKNMNSKLQLENDELKSALSTYKQLYDSGVDHIKVLTVNSVKKDMHSQNLKELIKQIKDLQGQTEDAAQLGKLQHKLMVCRWEQQEVNKKYDKQCGLVQELEMRNQSLENENNSLTDEFAQLHSLMNQRIKEKDATISDLNDKIIPTVSHQKIQELNNKMNDLAQAKVELEFSNKNQREQLYERQLRIDYLETNQRGFADLEKDLGERDRTKQQQTIYDYGKQISELRSQLMEQKQQIAKQREKELYLQKVYQQSNEHIKELQAEISLKEQKHRENEQIRQKQLQEKYTDQQQMQKKFDEERNQQDKFNERLQNLQTGNQGNYRQGTRKQYNKDHEASEEDEGVVTDKTKQLQVEVQKLTDEIETLKNEKREMVHQLEEREKNVKEAISTQYRETAHTKEDIEQITKKAVEDQSNKFASVAQKTIQTLQSLITEKNGQLEQKDRLIQRMRDDFMEEKKADLDEIRRLSNQIVAQNQTSIQKMQNSILQQNGSIVESNAYWGDVGELLHEKDKQFEETTIKLANEKKYNERLKQQIADLTAHNLQLEGDVEVEKKKNETQKMQVEIKQIRKKLADKDKELMRIQALVQDLTTEKVNVTTQQITYKDKMEKVLSSQKQDKEKEKMLKQQQLSGNYEEIKLQRKEITSLKETIEIMKQQSQKDREKLKKQTVDQQASQKSLEDQPQSKLGVQGKATGDEQLKNKIRQLEKAEKDLNMKLRQVEEENNDLKKQAMKSGGSNSLIKFGFLQPPEKKMQFSSLDELLTIWRKYETYTQSIWSKETMKNQKYKSVYQELNEQATEVDRGDLKVKEVKFQQFYQIMRIRGIKFKDNQHNLIEDEDNDFVTAQKTIAIYPFQLALQDQKEMSVGSDDKITDKDLEYAVSVQSNKEKIVDRPKQPERRSSIQRAGVPPRKQSQQETKKTELQQQQENKKIRLLNSQKDQHRQEKQKMERQLTNYQDKIRRLEYDLQRSNQNPVLGQSSKRPSTTQAHAISELKDNNYLLEDKVEGLKMDIHKKDVHIQKLGEEKNKLEEFLKSSKIENQKNKQRLDTWMTQKVGVETLRRENVQEKDDLIRNLKQKLEDQRDRDSELTDKYYDVLEQNKELVYVKDNFDIQVERLQNRIVELQEYKKIYGGNKEDEPDIPVGTVKKGFRK